MQNVEPRTRIEQLLGRIATGIEAEKDPGKLIVTFSGETGNDKDPAACDKTYAEIDAAFKSGREVEGRYGTFILRLMRGASQHGLYDFYCYFMTDFSEETFYEIFAGIQSDGSVDVKVRGDV